jgi:glycosyltransferase involved in cell wall biosynthesis
LGVVYDGIDWQNSGSTVTRMEARQRFGVPENAYLVGCVGHFTAEKGHGLLIRAFADLAAASPKAQLLLVGDGALRAQYLRQVQDLKLEETVHFAGFVADLENVWPALDLFVFPSLQEGLGSSLLAAMAAGVPVCASQSGGIPEIVTPGETGYLFAPGDSNALVSTLMTAIANDQQTREMGRAASRVVGDRFTTDRMVRETYEIYTNVLED